MDQIERAQQAQSHAIEDALANRPRMRIGLPFCERVDCREAITPVRQYMGARLCIDCQHEAEAKSARICARGAV